MTARGALLQAARDLYENSWRLILPNLLLAAVAVLALLAALYARPALLLVVAVGPFAAALFHCAVKLQQTESLRVSDAFVGLALHWRRGIALGCLLALATVLTISSISFYARLGVLALPFVVTALYLVVLFVVWQIHLWPVALRDERLPLGTILREATHGFARRPRSSFGLAASLLAVNAVAAVGILPLLTLTIAYSALAAVRFVLAPPPEEAPS
jgi:hypothetical protein